jgi:hypothetical protein
MPVPDSNLPAKAKPAFTDDDEQAVTLTREELLSILQNAKPPEELGDIDRDF